MSGRRQDGRWAVSELGTGVSLLGQVQSGSDSIEASLDLNEIGPGIDWKHISEGPVCVRWNWFEHGCRELRLAQSGRNLEVLLGGEVRLEA
jgi:hypothetical protein